VDELSAGFARGVLASGHGAVAGLLEAAVLLDVEMQQLARAGVLVAQHGRGGFELGEPIESGTAQQPAHGGPPYADGLGDLVLGLALALLDDPPDCRRGCGMRTAAGRELRSTSPEDPSAR